VAIILNELVDFENPRGIPAGTRRYAYVLGGHLAGLGIHIAWLTSQDYVDHLKVDTFLSGKHRCQFLGYMDAVYHSGIE